MSTDQDLQSVGHQSAPSGRVARTTLNGPMSRSHHRTIDAIFRHPAAENLAWRDVVSLFHAVGAVEDEHNGKVVFRVGQVHITLKKPHGNHIGVDEVVDLRHFLLESECITASVLADPPDRAAPDLLVVVDHHEARVFDLDVRSRDVEEHSIEPYDPHHFLHHLTHKDQPRERGQRAPEDVGFYQDIAVALADAGRIVVFGHGAGHSSAEAHLVAYLRTHHRTVFDRLARVVATDFAAMTTPELLDAGRRALREEGPRHVEDAGAA